MLLALTACGEAGPLDGLGSRSSEWVHEGVLTTTTSARVVIQVADEGLIDATDLLWTNDDLGDPAVAEAAAVIAAVWDRQVGSRFVQASRLEIATALPTLRFPSLVPQQVRWVTSQLVYEEATQQLDGTTSAAFGLWAVEPYSANEGRLGVLRVGAAPGGTGTGRSDTVPILVPDGVTMAWTEGGLRYELFCRSSIPEPVCLAVIDSFEPLSGLLAQ